MADSARMGGLVGFKRGQISENLSFPTNQATNQANRTGKLSFTNYKYQKQSEVFTTRSELKKTITAVNREIINIAFATILLLL